MDYDLAIFTGIIFSDVDDSSQDLKLIDDLGKLKICMSYNNDDRVLENLITDFLEKVTSFDARVFLKKTVLQVGVYYSLEESAVFSVRLSSECLSALAELLIDVEVTGYPCSD